MKPNIFLGIIGLLIIISVSIIYIFIWIFNTKTFIQTYNDYIKFMDILGKPNKRSK